MNGQEVNLVYKGEEVVRVGSDSQVVIEVQQSSQRAPKSELRQQPQREEPSELELRLRRLTRIDNSECLGLNREIFNLYGFQENEWYEFTYLFQTD